MYNIITFKGELMKKLFVLTILFSAASLSAATIEESHGLLTAAQSARNEALARAKEHEAAVKHAFTLAQQKPGAETYQRLEAAIAEHGKAVDHCEQCIHGIQSALHTINREHRNFVRGDAWAGTVERGSTAPRAA